MDNFPDDPTALRFDPPKRKAGRPREADRSEGQIAAREAYKQDKVRANTRVLTAVEREKIAQILSGQGNRADVARVLNIPITHGVEVNRHVNDPRVQTRAQEILRTKFERRNITGDRVLTELARLAFASAKDMFNPETNKLLELHDMDDDTAATIIGFEIEERFEGHGTKATPYTVKKIRRGDKLGALTVLAKHFKLVNDNDGVNALAGALADRLNAAKKRVMPVEEVTDVEDQETMPITYQGDNDEVDKLW